MGSKFVVPGGSGPLIPQIPVSAKASLGTSGNLQVNSTPPAVSIDPDVSTQAQTWGTPYTILVGDNNPITPGTNPLPVGPSQADGSKMSFPWWLWVLAILGIAFIAGRRRRYV